MTLLPEVLHQLAQAAAKQTAETTAPKPAEQSAQATLLLAVASATRTA